MKRDYKRILGALMFIVGVIMLSASQTGITGNVITDRTGAIGSVLSLILIVGGIFLMAKDIGNLLESNDSIENLMISNRFKKAIKKHDIDEINDAIKKINTRLGNEHKLKGYKNKYAIKVSKGARVIYEKFNKGINLENYLPAHEYNRLYE